MTRAAGGGPTPERPFPERRWGSDRNPLRTPLVALAKSRFGSSVVRRLAPLDRRLLSRSNGRFTILGPIGTPTMLLTTTGRKSGLPRTSPLLYVRDDPHIYVVGSNFGQDHHPAWTGNLLADPACTVLTDGHPVAAHAELLDGAERDRVYRRFEDLIGVYSEYKGRTDRAIRVFRLTAG